MMKYLGLIIGWFLVAVVLLILLVVVAVVEFGGLTPGLMGKAFGVWLLVGLVGAALGAVVAYYKVKGLVNNLKEMAKDFDSQETVVNSYLPVISRADAGQAEKMAADAQAQKLHKEMLEAGFAHEGDFVMDEMQTLVFAGYVHPERNMYGMVCFLPSKGTWAELSGDFEDGANLFVSGLMQPMVMDTRPKVIRVMQPGAGVAELLELFEKNKPGGPEAVMVKVEGTSFKKNFEAYWWIDKSWRRARGGTTMDELRRMRAAGVVGDEGTSDDQLKQALEMENEKWKEAWTQVPGQLIDRHLKSAGVDEDNDAYSDRHMRLVAAFEGQSLDEFTEYLSERLHNLHEQGQSEAVSSETTQSFRPSTFRPGADGYKLAAAADGKADGLAGAAAASMKYPDWFKEVHAGDHPMRHVIYEVCQS